MVLIIAGLGTVVSGDLQSKVMFEVQPMKMAAAEALYETQQPAGFSVITVGTPDGEHELWSVTVPGLLSFLATGDFNGKVVGINELQQQYTERFGPGNLLPVHPAHLLVLPLDDRARHGRHGPRRPVAAVRPR